MQMVLGVTPPVPSGLNVKANGTRNTGRVYFQDDRRTIYDRKPRLLYGVSQMRFHPIRRNGGFILHVSSQSSCTNFHSRDWDCSTGRFDYYCFGVAMRSGRMLSANVTKEPIW